MGENLEFTRNLREIYEKKTSEVDLGVVKDKGGGEQFLNRIKSIEENTTVESQHKALHKITLRSVTTKQQSTMHERKHE